MNEIVSQLTANYDKADKLERCGLVLKDGTIIEVENKHEEPTNGFRMPVAELVKHEDNLLGTWHTHPMDTANLSESDYMGFANWPDLKHFIIGLDGVRCFEVQPPLIVEVDL